MIAIAMGLQAAIELALVAPAVALAAWRTPKPTWRPLAGFAILSALNTILLSLPRMVPDLEFNWQGKILGVLWVVAFIALAPGVTAREVGLAAPLRGWLRPFVYAVLVWCVFISIGFAAGNRVHYAAEGWLFESTMPGLAEELAFRGVFMALLDRAFGRPWSVLRAQLGWSIVVTGILFAVVHVVDVDRRGHVDFAWANARHTLVAGFIWGWLRARTGSVWPCVIAHNIANLSLPLLSLAG